MSVFSKAAAAYKKHGASGFFRKLCGYVRANYLDRLGLSVLFNRKKYRAEIGKILLAGGYDRIILFRNSFGYDAEMFQRPQHMAWNLAKRGCLVLYEVTSVSDRVKTYREQGERLYLFNFNNSPLRKILEEEIKKTAAPRYVLVCSTDWKLSPPDIERLMADGFGFIYDYIDHISPELTGTGEVPPSIAEKYDFAMNNKDVAVVVTADDLRRDVVSKRGDGNLVLAGNGVDVSFFGEFDPSFVPEREFSDVINNGKINVCYYGALAKWFDYGLVRRVAATGKYNVILIGVKYDSSFDEEKFDRVPGVYYIGKKNYKVLKYYAASCDILTIPFLINPITLATSPLKLYEYMALGKPIVTTAITECVGRDGVFAADDRDEFIRYLDDAYAKRDDPDYLALLRKGAAENDWSEKAKIITDRLGENERTVSE